MSKGFQVCAYCGERTPDKDITADHVIARSWYPEAAVQQQKPTVPSCRKCNNSFSTPERDLLTRLSFCMDPEDPQLARITTRVKRSINPREAKNPRDWMARFNQRQQIIADLRPLNQRTRAGLLPSFQSNEEKGSNTVIQIPSELLDLVLEKWIRGFFFLELGYPVPEGFEVSTYHLRDKDANDAFREVWHMGKHWKPSEGVHIAHFVTDERNGYAMAALLWKEFRAYGFVIPKPALGDANTIDERRTK